MNQNVTATDIQTVQSKDGTTIAYEKVGSGPALVLVDGALCYRDFGPCRSLASHVADRFTVYFYDRRGRGKSGDTQPYSPEREFEDLDAMIQAAGGNAYVAGFSSGGALALLAAAAGVPMRRVAAYEPPYVGRSTKDGKTIDDLGQLEARLARGDRGGAVGYFMVTMVGGPAFLPLMMRLFPKVWKQLKSVAHTLPNDTRIMDGFEVPTATLAKVSVPTLIMNGGKAKPNMARGVNAVADAVPGAVHKTLPGQTHQVKDDALAPELISFFTE